MIDAVVYWLHLKSMTDPRSQGYIGITTKGAKGRFKCHLHAAKKGSKLHVHCAIRKYGDEIEVTVLHNEPLEFCQLIEWGYRSEVCVGWNIGIGGASPRVGSKASEDTRRKQSISQTGRKHSDETIAKMSLVKLGKIQSPESKVNRAKANILRTGGGNKKIMGWLHGLANKSTWAIADRLHTCFMAHESIGVHHLAKAFGVTPSSAAQVHAKFLNGWNPVQDDSWVKWSENVKDKIGGGWHIGDKLMEFEPNEDWNNARAIQSNWAQVDIIKGMLEAGEGPADTLRSIGLSPKSGALAKIFKKLKSGWIPSEDIAYQTWLTEYKLKEAANVPQTIPAP